MVTTLAFVLALDADILRCTKDAHGRPFVTRQQWLYVHRELDSDDPKRVIELIHPTRGVKVRVAHTASAEMNHWRLMVTRERWFRADIVKKLSGAPSGTYDWRFPGYTYRAVSDLSPAQNPNLIIGPDTMKGNMLYRDEKTDPGPIKRQHKRYWRALTRARPLVYIKMTCIDGRLWLDEISSDTLID